MQQKRQITRAHPNLSHRSALYANAHSIRLPYRRHRLRRTMLHVHAGLAVGRRVNGEIQCYAI
jgi:hypothetical protein